VSTDLASPVAGLRSLLMQALHPLAMAGVGQHSGWRRDPVGRLAATSAYLTTARGRTLTSYHTLQNDLRNAGATWANREVVVHGNLVTGRWPSGIPAFTREMLNLFAVARGA
jgi:putative intracellular protease/amidase